MDLSIPLFLNLAYAYVLASKLIKCSNIEYSLSKGSGYTRSHQTLPLCVGFTHPIYASPCIAHVGTYFRINISTMEAVAYFYIILRWLPKSSPPPTLHHPIFIELWTISSSYSRTRWKLLHHV
ncbi:hypothetical protein PGTUg99_004477 [Puccinia graminis f. sp. tritici]|uniref:Uncharacterized protein n=1 Tax=Puccinia graminis f. sp. tritici TaxID=56615 RepID=A0A5B0P699_PUCGR|nr:hypothetical protein PGTUg99_004477 [Puccinia graminis f. sp. tritici]